MSTVAYQQAGGQTSAQWGGSGSYKATGTDDDVVDAEFEEKQ